MGYIIRLDDASDYMDIEKWSQMEKLLDKYGVKPIFGIIPKNADESIVSKYKRIPEFWCLIRRWIDKGWTPAMHGYEHRYVTKEGGINPVNARSEFAGLPYEEQAEKISKGYQVLVEQGIKPDIFFAPSHTFDRNTLKAIKAETPIRIISDTVAWDIYKDGDFWYIPQQSGVVRRLPFAISTICIHPNRINSDKMKTIEYFFRSHKGKIMIFDDIAFNERRRNMFELLLQKVYYMK